MRDYPKFFKSKRPRIRRHLRVCRGKLRFPAIQGDAMLLARINTYDAFRRVR